MKKNSQYFLRVFFGNRTFFFKNFVFFMILNVLAKSIYPISIIDDFIIILNLQIEIE